MFIIRFPESVLPYTSEPIENGTDGQHGIITNSKSCLMHNEKTESDTLHTSFNTEEESSSEDKDPSSDRETLSISENG